MRILDLPPDSIVSAGWNANEMDDAMRSHLLCSIQRFGLVVPLVVRPLPGGRYETVGGNQRLGVLRELGAATVSCVVVQADDAEARLLSQVLNHVAGSDNLGLRAETLRHILDAMPMDEVLGLLPETAASLQALTAIREESISQALQKWQQAQQARLHHLSFELTESQISVVENVLERLLPLAAQDQGSPNRRGTALYLLCLGYLERANSVEEPTQ